MVKRGRGRRGSLVQSASWDSPASLNLLENQEEEREEDEDKDDEDDDEDEDKDEDEDEEEEEEEEEERDHDPNRSSFWTRSRPSSWASSITTFHLRK